jgi:hypothetical protein
MKDGWTPGCNVKADVPDDQKGRHGDVFEEVTVIASSLRHVGVLTTIEERVRFAVVGSAETSVIDGCQSCCSVTP